MSRSIYTVSSLVHYLKQSIDQDMSLQSILIKGEISNFTNHRSGHWYFTLKDARSKLSCVMFSSYASRCKILLKEGMQVIVQASLSVYEAQGSCQLYVTGVQVDGLGDLFLQFEQLKEKLALEGLFDASHKKPLPTYPMHIVLISAKEGAAIQDMNTTIARRWPLAKVSFLPSLVQGKEAASAIIENLKKAEALHPDVILLARGGGAIEDLWCFNDEALARYLYQMESVVITGVGHETDTTLVDFVSDARAATPTAAAELATPDIKEVKQLLSTQKSHMQKACVRLLQQHRSNLTLLRQHRFLANPLTYIREEQMKLMMQTKALEQVEHLVARKQSQLESYKTTLAHGFTQRLLMAKQDTLHISETLQVQMRRQLEEQRTNMVKQTVLLDAFSPLKILSRGYGVLYQDQHVVKSIHDMKEKQLQIRMHDGIVHTQIIEKEEF